METTDVEQTSLGFEHLSYGFEWKSFVQYRNRHSGLVMCTKITLIEQQSPRCVKCRAEGKGACAPVSLLC